MKNQELRKTAKIWQLMPQMLLNKLKVLLVLFN
jgi:hypothetical protein